MTRANHAIKNITTSVRITQDMDRIIDEAAQKIGASKGQIFRLGAYETARQILTDQQVAEELSARFAI